MHTHDVPLHDVLGCLVLGLAIGWLWRPRAVHPGIVALRTFLWRAWYAIPFVIYVSQLIAQDRKKSGED